MDFNSNKKRSLNGILKYDKSENASHKENGSVEGASVEEQAPQGSAEDSEQIFNKFISNIKKHPELLVYLAIALIPIARTGLARTALKTAVIRSGGLFLRLKAYLWPRARASWQIAKKISTYIKNNPEQLNILLKHMKNMGGSSARSAVLIKAFEIFSELLTAKK